MEPRISAARYVDALAALQQAREQLPEWFDGITALLTPGARSLRSEPPNSKEIAPCSRIHASRARKLDGELACCTRARA